MEFVGGKGEGSVRGRGLSHAVESATTAVGWNCSSKSEASSSSMAGYGKGGEREREREREIKGEDGAYCSEQ